MPLGVLPALRPYTIEETAAGPVTLTWRAWTVFVVNQAVAAPFTANLPPYPTPGTIVQVKDGLGDASVNAITIDGNGHLIDGAATTSITTDYGAVYLGFDGSEWRLLANVGSGGGGGGGVNSVTVTQPLTLTASNIAVYYDGQLWRAADASDGNKLGLGIVTNRTVDPNGITETFTVVFSGVITLTETPPLPLVAGQYYFTSAVTPGLLTSTEPSNPGEFSNPLLFALSATEGLVLPFRPSAVATFPGPATDLLDAAGNSVVIGSGLAYTGGPGGTLSASGAGPYPALNAATTHWYKCDDASGNLINSAPGGADPLVPILSSTSVVIYQDHSLYRRGTASLRPTFEFQNTASNRFEAAFGAAISTAAGLIVEGVFMIDTVQTPGFIFEMATANRAINMFARIEGSVISGGFTPPGTAVSMGPGYTPISGGPYHVACLTTAGGAACEFWVNGALCATAGVMGVTNFTYLAVGNVVQAGVAGNPTIPFKGGSIGDVRITPSDLGSQAARRAYFRAAYVAACQQ